MNQLQVGFAKVNIDPVLGIFIRGYFVPRYANVPDPADLPLAHKYKELHDAGRDDEIPYTAMELLRGL